jgi:hypothetical protein
LWREGFYGSKGLLRTDVPLSASLSSN